VPAVLVQSGVVIADSEAGPETEVEAKAADRVVFFSDAVLAIAITLLALDLPIPALDHHLTEVELLRQFGHDWSTYLNFVISFLVIGNHWLSHRHIFRYVCRTDSVVGRLNMLWLLMMIATPYATRLLTGDGARGVRFLIYGLIQIIATLCLLGISRHTARAGLLLPDAPERARHPDPLPYLAWVLVFLVSIPVSFATAWAYAIWALMPATTRGLHQLRAHRSQVPAPEVPGRDAQN
jgi:uncharacterized membrane protein